MDVREVRQEDVVHLNMCVCVCVCVCVMRCYMSLYCSEMRDLLPSEALVPVGEDKHVACSATDVREVRREANAEAEEQVRDVDNEHLNRAANYTTTLDQAYTCVTSRHKLDSRDQARRLQVEAVDVDVREVRHEDVVHLGMRVCVCVLCAVTRLGSP